MDIDEAVRVVCALADGCDPRTGVALPPDSPCQDPTVRDALCLAARALGRTAQSDEGAPHAARSEPAPNLRNQGKPWTSAHARELRSQFEAGTPVRTIAERMGRSTKAIAALVVAMGLATDVSLADTAQPAPGERPELAAPGDEQAAPARSAGSDDGRVASSQVGRWLRGSRAARPAD